MTRYSLDSSALVKRYVAERGSGWVVERVDGEELIFVSRLAIVEVTAAVSRRARAGDLSAEHAESIHGALEDEFRNRFEVVELGGAVVTRALDLTRTQALRAADAIQLACAILAPGSAPSQPVLVSSDVELNDAARREGLEVIDPSTG